MSHSSSCSSTRRLTPSPATMLPSMLVGGASVCHSVSARLSICSRKTAPWASRPAPGCGDAYCAHFRRVLPTSMARKLIGATIGGASARRQDGIGPRNQQLAHATQRLHGRQRAVRLDDARFDLVDEVGQLGT